VSEEDAPATEDHEQRAGAMEAPVTRRYLGVLLMVLGLLSVITFIAFATNKSSDVEERIATYALVDAVGMALIWLALKRTTDPRRLAIGMFAASALFLLMLGLCLSRLL